MNITKHIPNTITCLNLFSGCIACVMAFQGQYFYAALFIYLSAIFDFFDGLTARTFNAYSGIGKELDSLSDMVSFGVAPGIILFSWLKGITPDDSFLPYTAFLIPVFSALRLAKFNVDTRQTYSFIGLPTPANAIFIASLISLIDLPVLVDINTKMIFITPLASLLDRDFVLNILSNSWIITALILILSFLLISNLPMFSLKFENLTWKDNKTCYIFLILSFVLWMIFLWTAIPLIIILFILMSLFLHWIKNK